MGELFVDFMFTVFQSLIAHIDWNSTLTISFHVLISLYTKNNHYNYTTTKPIPSSAQIYITLWMIIVKVYSFFDGLSYPEAATTLAIILLAWLAMVFCD